MHTTSAAHRGRTLVFALMMALIVSLAVGIAPSHAVGTLHVANSGSDTVACGSEVSPCQTIQFAVDQAAPGDTIEVAAGTYEELVDIDKSITLNGANAGVDPNTGVRDDESIITGNSGIRLLHSATDVTIDGFEFTAMAGASSYEHAAILMPPDEDGNNTAPFNHFTDITIQNNHFHDLTARPVLKDSTATFQGLYIRNNRMVNVENAVLSDDRTAIKIQAQGTCPLAGNLCGSGEISGNYIDGTTYAGIIIANVADFTITDNTIRNVPDNGINFGASGTGNRNITISGNTIENAANGGGDAAIRLKDGDYAGSVDVTGNTVTGPTLGLLVESGVDLSDEASLTIAGNDVAGTGDGLRVAAPADGIQISSNSFAGNAGVGVSHEGTGTLDAADNWWGCRAGPGNPGCDSVSGAVDASSPLTAEIVDVVVPASVSHATTSVSPAVTMVNDAGVTTVVTGNTNLDVGDNTVTVTTTLSVAGHDVDTDTATATVTRAPAPPEPDPAPSPTPTPDADQPQGEVAAEAEHQVDDGGTVTTDPDGTGPTAANPVISEVTTPTGGTVAITVIDTPDGKQVNEEVGDGEPLEGGATTGGGFAFLDYVVDIEAPPATPEEPLVLDFQLDESLFVTDDDAGSGDGSGDGTGDGDTGDDDDAPGSGGGFVQVFRNGVPVATCADPDSGVAEPDPCVIRSEAGGIAGLTVLTSQASVWTFATITGGCPAGLVPDAGFGDVADGAAHAAAIDCVRWWGIADGFDADTYGPSRRVSNAQAAAMVARLLAAAGVDLPADPADAFEDDDGCVHETEINQLAALDVVRGVRPIPALLWFEPGRRVTRSELATMLVRAYEIAAGQDLAAGPDAFSDDDGLVHEDDIDAAAAAGITDGTSATTFSPHTAATRGQAASLLTGLLDVLVADGIVVPPIT